MRSKKIICIATSNKVHRYYIVTRSLFFLQAGSCCNTERQAFTLGLPVPGKLPQRSSQRRYGVPRGFAWQVLWDLHRIRIPWRWQTHADTETLFFASWRRESETLGHLVVVEGHEVFSNKNREGYTLNMVCRYALPQYALFSIVLQRHCSVCFRFNAWALPLVSKTTVVKRRVCPELQHFFWTDINDAFALGY